MLDLDDFLGKSLTISFSLQIKKKIFKNLRKTENKFEIKKSTKNAYLAILQNFDVTEVTDAAFRIIDPKLTKLY